MHLFLTDCHPWNTAYTNQAGQIIYEVDSGGPKFGARKMMVAKNTLSASSLQWNALNDHRLAFKEDFIHLGEIEYHTFRNSRIKYGGQDQSVREFFRKSGWSFFGRNRIFTAPDGREYCWKMTARVCKLFIHGSETPVALFHRQRCRLFGASSPASLEIFPEGEHMKDIIVLTFVYIEKLRSDKERATRSHGGGGGPGGDGGGGGGE